MSGAYIAGIATGAGALLGWLLWALQRGKARAAAVATAQAQDRAAAEAKRAGGLERQLGLARKQLQRLRQDAWACASPTAVRDRLDSVLGDLQEADDDRGAVSDDGPAPGTAITGELR